MKIILKIGLYILAFLGVVFILLFLRESIEENQKEKAYLENCHKVKIGMTMNEVRNIMKNGLEIKYRGFDYEVNVVNGIPKEINMAYSVDGGSYIISVIIDTETGLVKSVNCPNK